MEPYLNDGEVVVMQSYFGFSITLALGCSLL